MRPHASIVVAFDKRNGIGYKQGIPWDFPLDRTFFKDVTDRGKGNLAAVVMGRTTFDGLRAPLSNRINIILTSRPLANSQPALSLLDAANPCAGQYTTTIQELPLVIDGMNNLGVPVYIAGGAAVYLWAAEHCVITDLFYTAINAEYPADTFFVWPQGIEINPAAAIRQFVIGNTQLVFANCRTRPDHWEYQYLDLLYKIMTRGADQEGRNGVTRSLFGETMRFDLATAFPLLTTKRVFFRGIFEELMFFLRGQTDTKILEAKGVTIWKKNTSSEFIKGAGLDLQEGDMGPMYGHLWRNWNGLDQFTACLDLLARDPFSRRIMMTTYNPQVAAKGVLYPCHGIATIFKAARQGAGYSLSCSMTQRSADMICGVPFNIASYALLVHLMCSILYAEGHSFVPGELIIHLADAHIYSAHFDVCRRQILRIPQGNPQLIVPAATRELNVEWEQIILKGYRPHYALLAEMQ